MEGAPFNRINRKDLPMRSRIIVSKNGQTLVARGQEYVAPSQSATTVLTSRQFEEDKPTYRRIAMIEAMKRADEYKAKQEARQRELAELEKEEQKQEQLEARRKASAARLAALAGFAKTA
jgi:cell shape-determining protein MreC